MYSHIESETTLLVSGVCHSVVEPRCVHYGISHEQEARTSRCSGTPGELYRYYTALH